MTKYIGSTDHQHNTPASTGVLLVNIGTPNEPTTAAVRKYLAEFLSDPRIIELPGFIWQPILHGIILRTRPKRSALAYKKIWTENGSPLMEISLKQFNAIKEGLVDQVKGPVKIELAMRYGNPSIKDSLEKLRQANVQQLFIFPLYPQYSATSTASAFDAVTDVLRHWRWVPELRMLNHYHDDKGYIDALADSIRAHWAGKGKRDKLLFSFHGLPKQYFLAGDPYFCQCHKTARLVAEQLELDVHYWQIAFQSRFGPNEWLKPYTLKTLIEWGKQGIQKVDVICPGFAADCLETLEEIQMRYKDAFLNAGGSQFTYIPALNDNVMHISALTDLIIKHCQGWPEFNQDWNKETTHKELHQSSQRYTEMKG